MGRDMSNIESERVTADVQDEVVVFLIGMRINALWKLHKWVPVFLAMPRMLSELEAHEDSGLLDYRTRWGGRNFEVIQYWRSFEALRGYAHDREAEHLQAWADFNRRFRSDGSVGIWHETYLVHEDTYEAVYNNMPPYGLAAATRMVPATGRRATAAGRLGWSEGHDAPVSLEGNMSSAANSDE